MPMPPKSKSACFEPTVPLPPQTILSLETELSYFRRHHPLLLETDLRSFGRADYPRPYLYPVGRRGGTPEKDCLDWAQSPLTPAVAAAIRNFTESQPPNHSRQPTPAPTRACSRQPTPATQGAQPRQPTPGPSTPLSIRDSPPPPQIPSRKRLHRSKSVRFPSDATEGDDDNQGAKVAVSVALPDADGLISRPEGEVGRRQRGFPLNDVLGWPEEKLKPFRELVNSYVGNYLDHSQSASNQPKNAVADLTKLAKLQIHAKHPGIVDGYRDAWPIRDMIHLRLKYTSARIREHKAPVPQGSDYPLNLKKALKNVCERGKVREGEKGKGKERAGDQEEEDWEEEE